MLQTVGEHLSTLKLSLDMFKIFMFKPRADIGNLNTYKNMRYLKVEAGA